MSLMTSFVSNTPPQMERSPSACTKCFTLVFGSGFVRRSVVMFLVGQYTSSIAIFNRVVDEVPSNIDVFCSGMELPLQMSECDSGLVIQIKNKGAFKWLEDFLRKHWNQMSSLAVCIAAIYSALVVDKVTSSCFFEHQETAPPSIRMMCPEISCLCSCMAPSASVNPSKP